MQTLTDHHFTKSPKLFRRKGLHDVRQVLLGDRYVIDDSFADQAINKVSATALPLCLQLWQVVVNILCSEKAPLGYADYCHVAIGSRSFGSR